MTTDGPFDRNDWVTLDGFAHPGSPAGGGGPGHFRVPGPLGAYESSSPLPHPQSHAARQMDSHDLARAHDESRAIKFLTRLVGADHWNHLRVMAEAMLGPQSFGIGVCVGIVKNPLAGIAGLLELQKTFILADLYDRIERPGSWSWTNALPMIGGTPALSLGTAGLLTLGFIKRDDLRDAHERREQIKKEVTEVMAHPLDYLSGLPGKIRDDYPSKWMRFVSSVSSQISNPSSKQGKFWATCWWTSSRR